MLQSQLTQTAAIQEQMDEQLKLAIAENNLAKVSELIASCPHLILPVELAIKSDRPEILKLFIEKGASLKKFSKHDLLFRFACQQLQKSTGSTLLQLLLDREIYDIEGSDITRWDLYAALGDIENLQGLFSSQGNENIKKEAILSAAIAGQTKVLNYIRNTGFDLNQPSGEREFEGETPLWMACAMGHAEVVRFLIDVVKVNPSAPLLSGFYKGTTPIFIAAHNGRVAILELLHSKGFNLNQPCGEGKLEGQTPLWVACAKGHTETVRFLIDVVKVNPSAPMLPGGIKGVTPIHMATYNGCVAILELLHSKGFNLNQPCGEGEFEGQTPLWLACAWGHVETVRFLIDVVKVNPSAPMLSGGRKGATPIFKAAYNGRVAILELLHSKGFNLNQPCGEGKFEWQTPLWLACAMGHTETVQFLINNGKADASASMKVRGHEGITPAFIASEGIAGYSVSQEDKVCILKLLHESGIDLNQPCGEGEFEGQTPLWIALINKKLVVAAYILSVCESPLLIIGKNIQPSELEKVYSFIEKRLRLFLDKQTIIHIDSSRMGIEQSESSSESNSESERVKLNGKITKEILHKIIKLLIKNGLNREFVLKSFETIGFKHETQQLFTLNEHAINTVVIYHRALISSVLSGFRKLPLESSFEWQENSKVKKISPDELPQFLHQLLGSMISKVDIELKLLSCLKSGLNETLFSYSVNNALQDILVPGTLTNSECILLQDIINDIAGIDYKIGTEIRQSSSEILTSARPEIRFIEPEDKTLQNKANDTKSALTPQYTNALNTSKRPFSQTGNSVVQDNENLSATDEGAKVNSPTPKKQNIYACAGS